VFHTLVVFLLNLHARWKGSKARGGDPLSPVLLNCALQEVFRSLNWENRGISRNGEKIADLRFADDVILISSSEKE